MKYWMSIDCFTASIWDNPHLSKKAIAAFLANLTSDEREAREHGKFTHLSGLVYKGIKRGVHIVDPFDWDPSWPVWEAIDPHPRKEHAVIWVGVAPNGELYIIDDLWIQCGIEELAEMIKEKRSRGHYRVVRTLIDTSSESPDGTRDMTPRKMLSLNGIHTSLASKFAQKAKSIRAVQELLILKQDNLGDLRPNLYTFSTCHRVIYEWFHYVWKDDGEEPKKVHDDTMDCLRYIIIDGPRFEVTTKTYRRKGKPMAGYGGTTCKNKLKGFKT